jgi:hypothetical protein
MNARTWLGRLAGQLPGWHVWRSSPGGWFAVPAPADMTHDGALRLPNRVNAATPTALRTLCRERYGWDDYCESCGVLARKCGHRSPEARVRA